MENTSIKPTYSKGTTNVKNKGVQNNVVNTRKSNTGSNEALPSVEVNMAEWNKWREWKTKINENSAIEAMNFVKVLCDSYQSELSKSKEGYEGKKRIIHKQNYDRCTEIEEDKKCLVRNFEKIKENSVMQLDLDRRIISEHENKLRVFILNNEHKNPLRKIMINLIKGFTVKQYQIERESFKEVNELKKHLDNLFEQKSKQQQNLNEACINRENSLSNYYQATELLRFNNALEELNNKFKKESENIEKKHEKILEEIMSEDTISKYIKTVLSTNPSTDRYMCSESIPELVGLGEVSFDIARKSDLQPEVSQFILNGASKVIKEEYGKIVAKLPYCQILEDGISLFVNYSSSERANHQEELRNILLKLFMTFPPGKLEATMIDPLELGETFAMFTKLGEEQSRIIDTKIWSQEKDISECIYILRQKLETMTQAYGNDRATRLKKEPIRVLAITDFPTGFSQTALRDLQAIVRKSASFGVCVFIWANSEEVNKLAAKEQPILSEIKEKLQVATAKGRSLELESRKYKGVTLSIDKMDRARKNSSEIINTIAKGIHSSQNKIEKFVDMFDNIEDPNNWFGENSIQELAVPIGIKGANTIVKMTLGKTDGSTEHHALIAGQTGAGKSTLLHTIIMSTLLNYSPNEVQMYLVDFKEGVEFKSYTKYNLPSIKVIAIDSEREFGLNILKELCHELEVRADMFSRNGYEEISDYRKGTKNKVPKIMLIFDEVQELFRDRGNSDNITKECLQCLNKLITQGRAMGIHIILACQDFKLASAIQPLFSQMAIRIAIKGSEDSAKSVLGDNNAGAKQLQDRGPGAAIYNGHNGTESANVVFQVSYLEKEKRNEFLGKLNALQNHEALSKSGYGKTRILLTNAEDGRFNVFNELILNKKATKLVDNPKEYGIVIGEGFKLNGDFRIGIGTDPKSNMMIIGGEEKRAASMFYFTIISLLYNKLVNSEGDKDKELIHLVDLSVNEDYASPDNTNFQHLENLFHHQIKREKMNKMEELISSTYDTLLRRMDGKETMENRLFLMFFGINRAHRLINRNMYEENQSGDISTINKLYEIIKYGPEYGINFITWGESFNAISKILGANIEGSFAQRIVFASDSDTMEQLVMEHNGSGLRNTTAVYMNVYEDVRNTHFRPYEIPAKIWINRIAKAYSEFK